MHGFSVVLWDVESVNEYVSDCLDRIIGRECASTGKNIGERQRSMNGDLCARTAHKEGDSVKLFVSVAPSFFLTCKSPPGHLSS